jgi:hypothetical protein
MKQEVRFFSAAILSFAFAISGCSKSVDSPAGSGSRTWTISGQTHTLGAIEPLPGVVVTCAGVTTTSGADGAFELHNVPEGTSTITASKTDYDTYSSPIDVKSDVHHYIYMTFDGTDMTGFVSNVVDGPIKGAKVSFRGSVEMTDAAGRYEFASIKHGTDTLFVSHPSYILAKTPVEVRGAVQQLDIVLLRDSLVQVKAGIAKSVSEGQPDVSFFNPLELMYFSTNGYDINGQFLGVNRRHIYMYFEVPYLLYDSRVNVLDASIQIHAAFAYFATPFQTFAVGGPWTTSLTYRTQPALGSLLYSGSIGDSLTTRYWTVLDADGFKQLLKSYRLNGTNYGITVQGGKTDVTSFHSMYSTQFPPILTVKMRY